MWVGQQCTKLWYNWPLYVGCRILSSTTLASVDVYSEKFLKYFLQILLFWHKFNETRWMVFQVETSLRMLIRQAHSQPARRWQLKVTNCHQVCLCFTLFVGFLVLLFLFLKMSLWCYMSASLLYLNFLFFSLGNIILLPCIGSCRQHKRTLWGDEQEGCYNN